MNNFLIRSLVFSIFVLVIVPSAFALDVGYVVRNPSLIDSNDVLIKNILVDKGYEISFLDDVSFDSNNYDLVFVSGEVSSIEGVFDNINTKTFFLSNSAAKRAGLGFSSGKTTDKYVDVDDISQFISDELSLGLLQIYSNTDDLYYLSGCKAADSDSIITTRTSNTKSIILTVDENSMLIDSGCTDRDKSINERNLFFGFGEASSWNSNARDLFEKSLRWLINGGRIDDDGDGYYSIASGGDDCDDSDFDINLGSGDKDKNCVNDTPVIESYSPSSNLNIFENAEQEFQVSVSDDNINDVVISWKINGGIVGTGSSYTFKRAKGSYILKVEVSDGLLSIDRSWTVNVKDSSAFTCSEMNGNICNSNQICEDDLISVSNSNSCCSISCSEKPPEFSNINNLCEVEDNKIEIKFEDVEEDYKIGDKVDLRLRVDNDLDNEEFIVRGYLYDLTKDNVVERIKDEFDIEKNGFEIRDYEFDIDGDLEGDNQYSVYFYVENEDACNSKDVSVDIERDEVDIIIDKFNLDNDKVGCGGLLEVDSRVKNLGTIDNEVYIKIISSKLRINEETEKFDLEEYGKEDEEGRKFLFQVPENIESGEYKIRMEVGYDQRKESMEKGIVVDCKKSSVIEEIIETIRISNDEQVKVGETGEESVGENNFSGIKKFFVFVLVLIVVSSVGVVWWFFRG